MKRLATLSFALCAIVAGLLLLNTQYNVNANTNSVVHKAVLFADAKGYPSGITVLQDYGSYQLVQVSDSVLGQLSANQRDQLVLADEMNYLLFDARPFDTQAETLASLQLPTDLMTTDPQGNSLHLIQFVGPIKAEWLTAVEQAGASLVHYVAHNGYLVWADEAARANLDQLVTTSDFLQFSQPHQPYFKLGPSLHDRITTGIDASEVVPVVVQIYNHPNKNRTQQLIDQISVSEMAPWSALLNYETIIVNVPATEIVNLSQQPDVVWVGERFERELNDEVQNQILAANFDGSNSGPSAPGYLAWLDSYGFSTDPNDYPLVDVTDDGLGNGTVNTNDETLHVGGDIANPTRIEYVANCTTAANGGGPDGHGHINVSIVGGYDTRAGFPFRDPLGFQRGLGVNPYGRMGSVRIFGPGFNISACGGTDTGLIQEIQNNGAQISSNSWGCGGCASTYDDSSQAFDVGVRDADLTEAGNQELIFIFAAGNSGSGAGTVGTPGNGKNMITVGASENDRPNDEDGSWFDGCGIGSTGADNAMDIIFFSSRGPAPGGRVKPEIIAPGTHIQGTASTHPSYNGSSVCDQYRPSGQTEFAASSGTSHSTPAVSGVASLYYYWLENSYGLTPTPALMKAYLAAHPTYLTGVGANDNLPSNNQGYGMPDMATAFDDTPRVFVNQEHVFDNTGESWTWSGSVADPSRPVRIVMAYTDQAGAIGVSPQVNNLNLSAEIDGSLYLGNRFSGQWSVTGGSPDNNNNYEAIFLPAGTTGEIEITIDAFNIAGDGIPNFGDGTDQDFAFVCYNCADGSGQGVELTAVATDGSAEPGQTVNYTLHITNTSSIDEVYDINLTGNSWATVVDSAVVSLSAGASATLSVDVTVDADALAGQTDSALITAVAQSDPAIEDSVTLNTTADAVYSFDLMADEVALIGDPGTAVTYTVHIHNTGNTTDTVNLALTGETWASNLSDTAVTVAADDTATITVVVNIPADATGSDAVTITATSDSDPSVTDSLTLTTSVTGAGYTLFLPVVVRP